MAGGRVCHRQGDAQGGVGPQPRLVGRAVQGDECPVHPFLLLGGHPGDYRRDELVHIGDGFEHALAAVAVRVAVAQLQRLVDAGGGAGRDGGAARGAVAQNHFRLYRGVAAGVQDLAGANGADLAAHAVGLPCGPLTWRARWRCGVGSPSLSPCPPPPEGWRRGLSSRRRGRDRRSPRCPVPPGARRG